MATPQDPLSSLELWEPMYVGSQETLREVSRRLADLQVGVLLVPAVGGRIGVVSERDVVAALADGADPDEVWSADVMSTEVRIAHPQDAVVQAALEMLDAGLRHLVVLEDGDPVGVASIQDLLRHLVDAAQTVG